MNYHTHVNKRHREALYVDTDISQQRHALILRAHFLSFSRNCQYEYITKPRCSSPSSQQPGSCFYTEPFESTSHTSYLFNIHFNIILPSTPCGYFPSGFPTTTLYALFSLQFYIFWTSISTWF
jgi:hypothetical protein